MEDEFDDEIEDKIIENTPEIDEKIQNYIAGKFPESEDSENFTDPMSAMEQFKRMRETERKRNPGVDVIFKQLIKNQNVL